MDSNMPIVALQIVGNYCKRSPLLPIFIKRGSSTDYIYNLKAKNKQTNKEYRYNTKSKITRPKKRERI
jgi:hypothetical protein